MNKNTKIIVIAVVIFVVGFFAGMEFKSYQIRSALQGAFSDDTTNSEDNDKKETELEKAENENKTIIEKSVSDEIVLSTLSIKVTSVEEMQTISSRYSTPKTAKQGTKFVVIGMEVTNTTNSTFSFWPDTGLNLTDNQNREFFTYSDSIGSIEDYLNARELSPSIKEVGFIVFEIPEDSEQYSIITGKSGTEEVYKIILK